MLSTRSAASGPAAGMPGIEDVRAQLERILSSPEFPSAGRAPTFLRYVVEETLAGRAGRIKGYSIAIEVFGRDQTFTQDDPVVRIEAGRLRRALERYYLVEGNRDTVRIDIPKGGYIPAFSWNANAADTVEEPVAAHIELKSVSRRWSARDVALAGVTALLAASLSWIAWASASRVTGSQEGVQSAASSGRALGDAFHGMPSVAVVPFTNLEGGADAQLFAAGLTEELLTALPRFKEIKVFSSEASHVLAADGNAAWERKELGARYLLKGSVRASTGRLRVTARLLAAANGEIVWSRDYDDILASHDVPSVQTDVARRVATEIAQPFGIMAQVDAAKRFAADPDAYKCTLRFYAYRSDPSTEAHADQRDCLQITVAQHPTYATAWAMLSIIYLDEARFKFNAEIGAKPPTERALMAARRATQLDHNNTRGLQALMMALFFNRDVSEAMRMGDLAIASNPNDTELIGELGTSMALAGQWRRGADLLDQAIALNPAGGGSYHGTRALAAYMLNDGKTAAREIAKANIQTFPLFHAAATVIYAQAGKIEDARRQGQILAATRPDFLANINAELMARNLQPHDRLRLMSDLRKAGLPLPQEAADAVDTSDLQPR